MTPSPPKMVSLRSRVSQPPRLYFKISVYSMLKHPLKKRSIGENTILKLWWWRNAGCCWGVVSLRQKESPTICHYSIIILIIKIHIGYGDHPIKVSGITYIPDGPDPS